MELVRWFRCLQDKLAPEGAEGGFDGGDMAAIERVTQTADGFFIDAETMRQIQVGGFGVDRGVVQGELGRSRSRQRDDRQAADGRWDRQRLAVIDIE